MIRESGKFTRFASDLSVRQLNKDGKLGPVEDICLVRAEKTYLIRASIDTDPIIAQMVLRNLPIPHWYYRSQEWIDQPYYNPQQFVQPYVGPVDMANPLLYGEDTYFIDLLLTKYLERKYKTVRK